MITASTTGRQPDGTGDSWQRALAEGYRKPSELLSALGLAGSDVALSAEAERDFPMRVPREFAARMRPGDPQDPLLGQVLPRRQETETEPGFVQDPVGDLDSRQAAGVLKKYRGRALLIATGACAIHCRYCFRRHFPYAQENAARQQWSTSLQAVARDPDIRELILSGGDPLSLADSRLRPLIEGLAEIPHVQRLRIHTRLPVVLPARITDGLLGLLEAFPGPVTVVFHANHGNELDSTVASAARRLREIDALLLNQAVLLRGINDTVEAQLALSERLTGMGVTPYYLHQLDPVAGATHFPVPDREAIELVEALRRQAPGYMVPRLVREVAGDASKRPLAI